jgi:transposase
VERGGDYRLVAASLEPGAIVSEVARTAGIHRSQLYGWRRQRGVRGQAPRGFAAVQLAAEALPALPGTGVIEIEFAGRARMRINGAVAPALLTAAVAALSSGGRR